MATVANLLSTSLWVQSAIMSVVLHVDRRQNVLRIKVFKMALWELLSLRPTRTYDGVASTLRIRLVWSGRTEKPTAKPSTRSLPKSE